ncbi:MAG TPA: hypothetical protein V6D14_02930 [Coleofasciculaceae cyanobacterium]
MDTLASVVPIEMCDRIGAIVILVLAQVRHLGFFQNYTLSE